MKTPTIDELKTWYADAENVDKAHAAEIRTNILLASGNHYKNLPKRGYERVLDQVGTDTKLRLQENHIGKVCNRYISTIVNASPSVQCVPYNENELSDQKDAELSQAVVKDGEEKLGTENIIDKHANAFVIQGETAAFFYWDPYAGKQVGWEQAVSENGEALYKHPMTGEPTADAQSAGVMGEVIPHEPLQGDAPVFEGQIKWEIVHPYNLKRAKTAETFEDTPFVIIDKLVTKKEAMLVIKNNPNEEELKRAITENGDQSFKIFEGASGEYVDKKDQVLLKYWLFKPCYDYPKGWFAIQCNDAVLFENELPFGIWPFEFAGFRASAATPRCKSIIKDLRHPQLELNRLVSSAAYATMAFGDDKLITQMGGKVTLGTAYNGIKHLMVSPGANPQYFPGRDGGQFEGQIARQVKTIYDLADMDYEMQNQSTAQQDPQAMLYMSLKQKAKFSPYAAKFQRFVVNCWKIYLSLAKKYFSDDRIIKAVGRREAINIAEFKSMRDDGYQIKVVPANNDVDSLIGKNLQITTLLQYAGKDLPPEVKARLARMLPFMNEDAIFNSMLIDDENIESDILALDRGEQVESHPDDNHDMYIKRLTHRMKQSDFRLLPPNVQQNYMMLRKAHQDAKAQQLQELQKAQAGFIPSGGALVKADLYGKDGRRMTMPYEALKWLEEKLAQQGQTQDELKALGDQQAIQVMQMSQQQQQPGMSQAVGMQQPSPMPPQAQIQAG